MTKTNILTDLELKIKQDQRDWLARIARDKAIEPFFGNPGLELVQSAKGGIENGLDLAKDWGGKTKNWLGASKWVKSSKAKLDEVLEQAGGGDTPGWLAKLDQATEDLRETAKGLGGKLGEKSAELSLLGLKKGFELVMFEDTEAWALGRVKAVFPDKSINSLGEMGQLEESEREQLIAEYYPYDNPALKKFAKSLDWSFNLSLGAAAASQIPGTGVAAGALNLVKTLNKLAGRISSMSAIYGFGIPSAEHLFFFCAQILKSIEDFESNPEHQPIDPATLASLYQTDSLSGSGFGDMLKEALKKEAYMAVPGVGAISLGKIGLDDLMVDQMILHLVGNYFWINRLSGELGEEVTVALIGRWQQIYQGLVDTDWFKTPDEPQEKRSWKESLNGWGNKTEALQKRSEGLDQRAGEIFDLAWGLDDEEFTQKLPNWLGSSALGTPTTTL